MKRLPIEKQFCDNCEHKRGKYCCGLHGMTLVKWCQDWD